MSRLIKPDGGVGKTRERLMKNVAWTLRDLAGKPKLDEDARDMAAFMALCLREINDTIDETCAAWEKRDYWLKADQFRRDWAWSLTMADKFEKVVLQNQWNDLPALMAGLMQHMTKVNLPKTNKLAEAWRGAYAVLLEKRGMAQQYTVKSGK
ncbi:MAG: hypothetical protein ACT4QE_07715 [Anaerolineales bacterium]